MREFFKQLALLSVFCGIPIVSCTDSVIEEHDATEQTLPAEGRKGVRIAVQVPRNSISTYAVEAGNDDENHIDTLFVNIFENSVLKESKKFYGSTLQTVSMTNDSIVEIAFEAENLSGGAITAEVFANRTGITPVTGEIPLPDKNNAATWFMMSGSGALTFNGTSYNGTVHIVRNVAKLRVRIVKHTTCVPANLDILYDQITVETLQAPDRTQLMTPPPVSTPAGLGYIANYSLRKGSALRAEQPIATFTGGQIDSLYLYENYLDNGAYNSSNITKVKITLPSQEPGMPVKTAEYTYDLYTEGGYQVKRNYIYTLDIRVAGQTLDPFISLDILPWNDVGVSGDVNGAFLNLNRSTVNLTPASTYASPGTVNYLTDQTSVALDWSHIDPAHNIDTSVLYIQGRDGQVQFKWNGNGAPDQSFKDTLYVNAGNIVKSVILEYNVPAGNFGNWVGTFHRWNQTGERIIKMHNTGNWTATVTQGVSFIRLNGSNTDDPNWGASSAALGNDAGFDGSYPVSGTATTLSGSGVIYFRVGMTSALAYKGAQPRYGLIEVTTGEGVKKIYVRQGDEADYVMRKEDPNPANGNNQRQYTVKFSPFNLADPLRGTGGNHVSLHNDYVPGDAFDSRQFTDYPTQAGYFFQWNLGAGSLMKAYNPVNTITAVSGWEAATKNAWDRTLEPCPEGYRHPNDSLRSALTSEFRQSLYATPDNDAYGTTPPAGTDVSNSVWGYYADGFFDRLAIGTSPNGIDSTTVGFTSSNLATQGNTDVAYAGKLIYNPATNASLFLPASGVREGSGNGALTGAGAMATYWTSSPNGNNGWAFCFTPTSFYGYNNAHQGNGLSVRCVKIDFGLPGSPDDV